MHSHESEAIDREARVGCSAPLLPSAALQGLPECAQSGALKTARRSDAARTAKRGAALAAFVSLVPARERGKGTIPIIVIHRDSSL